MSPRLCYLFLVPLNDYESRKSFLWIMISHLLHNSNNTVCCVMTPFSWYFVHVSRIWTNIVLVLFKPISLYIIIIPILFRPFFCQLLSDVCNRSGVITPFFHLFRLIILTHIRRLIHYCIFDITWLCSYVFRFEENLFCCKMHIRRSIFTPLFPKSFPFATGGRRRSFCARLLWSVNSQEELLLPSVRHRRCQVSDVGRKRD